MDSNPDDLSDKNNILGQDMNSTLLSELILRILASEQEQSAVDGESILVLNPMGRVNQSLKQSGDLSP